MLIRPPDDSSVCGFIAKHECCELVTASHSNEDAATNNELTKNVFFLLLSKGIRFLGTSGGAVLSFFVFGTAEMCDILSTCKTKSS